MITISFKLKDPQLEKSISGTGKSKKAKKHIPFSKQSQTLVYLIAGFEYFETRENGSKKYMPLKYSTGLKIKPEFWNDKGNRPEYRAKLIKGFEFTTFNNRLNDIESACKTAYRELLTESCAITPDVLRERLDKKLEKPSKKVILNETFEQFLDRFILEIETGERLNKNKEPFKRNTVSNFKKFRSQFKKFQTAKDKKYNWDQINIQFYDDFVKFLLGKSYSNNSIGSHINRLKMLIHAATKEKLTSNVEVNSKDFKVLTNESQSIYLSVAEIAAIYNLEDSKLTAEEILVRDVFLVGCYTAQRYSDYSKICKENIRVLNGGVRIVDLNQQKTKQRVNIPIRPELERILAKYDYTMPKSNEVLMSAHLKNIGKKAEIKEKVRIEKIRGGLTLKTDHFKYELITTHTARRSACTNMYLAGINQIDCMRISGHKTAVQFMKYIRVTLEETANILAIHPYFNHLTIAK